MGIALDLLVVLTIAAALARGWKRGFVFQAAQLAMLVVVYFIARAVASGLDRKLAASFEVSPVVAGAVIFLGSFLVLAFIGTIVLGSVLRELAPDDSALSQLNRIAGTALGGAKGALFCYALIAGLITVGRASDARIPWKTSIAGKFVAEHNILDRGEVGAFAKLAWLVGTRDHDQLMADPRFAALTRLPGAGVFTSPDVLAAIGDNDWVVLMSHEPLWDFLKQEAVQKNLASFSWLE
jgi:uncharacterized membrane protein required for colicin V production